MPSNLHFSSKILITFAAALGIFFAAAQRAEGKVSIADSRNGQTTYEFTTDAGTIDVHLPSDIRAGDTISGMVIAEPAGATDGARRKNADTLSGYVVELAGEKAPVRAERDAYLTAYVSGVAFPTLSASDDKKSMEIKIDMAPENYYSPAKSDAPKKTWSPTDFTLPKYGQSGRPVLVAGALDGKVDTTSVTFGGMPGRILAESPRDLIAECPRGAGASEIAVTEQGQTVRGQMQIVNVQLGATKTVLAEGETATVSIRVDGLASELGAVPMSLVASDSVSMQGGNTQAIALDGAALGGVYETTRQITAVRPGPFDVSARLLAQDPPAQDPLFPGAFDMNGITGAQQLAEIAGAMEDGEDWLKRTLAALKARLAAAKDDKTRAWLKKKIKIVQNAMKKLGVSE